MPQRKLTIIPVKLHPDSKSALPRVSPQNPPSSICTIKTANAEITFYSGVEEHVIQAVMREVKHL